jgi:hypothetical protein
LVGIASRSIADADINRDEGGTRKPDEIPSMKTFRSGEVAACAVALSKLSKATQPKYQPFWFQYDEKEYGPLKRL